MNGASPTPLLEALAQARAGEASLAATPDVVELFLLRIGRTPFVVEASLIQEVVRAPPLTPLPSAPAFLVGVAAYRGDVVPVVDLARVLGRGETQLEARSRMAVARADGMVVALLADEIRGLIRVDVTSRQAPLLGTEESEFISAVVVAGDEPAHCLDLRRALTAARERVCSRR